MDDVQEIKNRLNIVDVVGSYVTLKKAGDNYKGLCPFHSEKSPSFMVNPERQIFKCFGCGESGDIFEFIQKEENLTFREALEVLASRANYQLTKNESFDKKYGQESTDNKSKLYKINLLTAQVFHKILLEHKTGKPALDYLKERGVSLESINTFQVGFAPRAQVLAPFLSKRGFTPSNLQSAGRPDRFYNRIIFPIQDALGNIVGFTGRTLDIEGQPKSTGPKYFNTPETAIFKKSRLLYGLRQARQAIKDQKYAVLLEGQMDVIAAYQAGIQNVLASSGTALTQDHLKIINRYTDNIIFSFDMDEAGHKATLKGLEMAWELGFTPKVAVLPKPYKDAGEAVKADPEIFKTALKGASYGMEWLVATTINQFKDTSTGKLTVDGKKQIAKQILPFIAKMADPIEQSHWTSYLAKQLAVSEKSILEALAKIKEKSPPKPVESPTPNIKPVHQLEPNEILYGLLRLHPNLKKDYLDLYKQLESAYNEDIKQLELAVEEYQKTLEPDQLPTTVKDLVNRYNSADKERLKLDFAISISQAEASGDRQKVKELLNKLQEELIK